MHSKNRLNINKNLTRNFASNNSIGITFRNKSVSNLSFFDDYFYGIVDADLMYNVNIYMRLNATIMNSMFKNIVWSLMFQ